MREASAAGAAPAAALLLEFLREPATLRPAFIQGLRALPQGDHVFRFAQGRFPHALIRDLTPGERDQVREAANAFIRQVCLREGATHYQVLCLPIDARPETVKEHYHLLMALIHPDRQEGAAGTWPKDSAPKVNGAYGVLIDEVQRRAYDHDLRRAGSPQRQAAGAWEAVATRAPAAKGAPVLLRKPAAVVGTVILTLLVLQAWWMGGVGREYTMLERALPAGMTSQWLRDALPDSSKPRFLEPHAAPSATKPEGLELKESDRLSLLSPLLRVFGGGARPAAVRPEPKAAAHTPEVAVTANAAVPVAAPIAPPASVAAVDAPPASRDGIAKVVADLPPSPVVDPPKLLAQAPAPAPAPSAATKSAPARGVATEDIEKLVIRLVSAYEAGDANRLMELVDTGALGFWESIKVRGNFTDFFRATRQRSLRLERLAWQDVDGKSRAEGEATIVADYNGDSSPTTRKVPVEMDIALRDGKPRITRLVLFPNGR